jgi:hypothetical protein
MGMAPESAGGLGLLGPGFVPGGTAARGRSRRLASLMAGRVPASSAAGGHISAANSVGSSVGSSSWCRAHPAVSVAVTEQIPQIRSSQ